MTECTECGATVHADKVEEGEILSCQDCGAELEVISLDPIKVHLAPQEQEDWGE